MNKSYITIKDEEEAPYDILGKQIEVFYLERPNNPDPKFDNPPFIVDDAGVNIETGKYIGGGEMDVNENSAGGGAHALHPWWMCDTGPHEGYVCDEEGSVEAIEGCCPVGHKGHQGERGYVEGDVYKLILISLGKALPDAKESFREVVADGIAKKITKYMGGK